MNNYTKMLLMLVVSFFIMYGVMFLNVDASDHIYLSLTRTYMALLMVCPMAVMMLLFMPMMYKSRKMNTAVYTVSVLTFAAALLLLRQQDFVSDTQYMKAMIPHHSSAILTSKHANIKDPEVKALSKQIIESQEKEIAQMKAMLQRIDTEN